MVDILWEGNPGKVGNKVECHQKKKKKKKGRMSPTIFRLTPDRFHVHLVIHSKDNAMQC